MPRLTRKIPAYRHRKARNLAVVTLDGRDNYLGPYGSPESKKEYDRLVAEWLAADRHVPTSPGNVATTALTVDELLLRYWRFAEGHYLRDGRPTRELDNIRDAVRPVRRLYGDTPAAEFRPSNLKAIVRAMVVDGLCRSTINYRVGKIRRMFRWAVENELVEASVYQALMAVSGLRKGKGSVRESSPVRPVPVEDVEAVLPFLTVPVAGLVRLQLLTGMRPGEAVAMKAEDLDRSGAVWIYRPASHKTEGYDRARAIPIGPKAQEVLKPFLNGADEGSHLFSPRVAVEARNTSRRLARSTPMTPSQKARKRKRSPKRAPGACYSKNAAHVGQVVRRLSGVSRQGGGIPPQVSAQQGNARRARTAPREIQAKLPPVALHEPSS
jgi:integrase